MISKKSKYALKALQALTRQQRNGNEPVLISDLSLREKIPRKFLEAILLDLKKSGILKSKMGRFGGYYLAKEAKSIRLSQVLKILEGPLEPLSCLRKGDSERCAECTEETECSVRLVFKEIYENAARILDQTSLDDLLDKANANHPESVYHI